MLLISSVVVYVRGCDPYTQNPCVDLFLLRNWKNAQRKCKCVHLAHYSGHIYTRFVAIEARCSDVGKKELKGNRGEVNWMTPLPETRCYE